MKHKHADNFTFTGRTLTKRQRFSVGILLITLVAFGLAAIQPATGQRKPNQGYGKEMEIPAGFDLFKTVQAGTRFKFAEEFTIPAGFFDKGSAAFAGTVSFKGVPIGSFRDQKTGKVDTIVERTKAATFEGPRSSATVPIEIVALSLESVTPIRVQVGKGSQLWNVKTELSRSRKSEGTMTIISRSERGGTFNSQFVVYALFTFTRQGDGAEKKLDVGDMKLGASSLEKITLGTRGAPWVRNCPRSTSTTSGLSDGFCAGTTPGGNIVVIDETGLLVKHGVILD
jgi:hypothetical protein